MERADEELTHHIVNHLYIGSVGAQPLYTYIHVSELFEDLNSLLTAGAMLFILIILVECDKIK